MCLADVAKVPLEEPELSQSGTLLYSSDTQEERCRVRPRAQQCNAPFFPSNRLNVNSNKDLLPRKLLALVYYHGTPSRRARPCFLPLANENPTPDLLPFSQRPENPSSLTDYLQQLIHTETVCIKHQHRPRH